MPAGWNLGTGGRQVPPVAFSQVCATTDARITFVQPANNRNLWITVHNLFSYLA
jgi:hypothetical protein